MLNIRYDITGYGSKVDQIDRVVHVSAEPSTIHTDCSATSQTTIPRPD